MPPRRLLQAAQGAAAARSSSLSLDLLLGPHFLMFCVCVRVTAAALSCSFLLRRSLRHMALVAIVLSIAASPPPPPQPLVGRFCSRC